MVEIRQARVGDWPEIGAFIDRTYGHGARFKQEARWRWQFRDAPGALCEDDRVPVWIAIEQGRVIGQIALQPGTLVLDGEALPIGWIVDVMIEEAARGRGLGHRIHDAMVAGAGVPLVTLTMAPATRRIAEKSGVCVTLGPVLQMVRVRRLSGATVAVLLRRLAETRGWLRGPAALFNASRIGPAALALALSALARPGRGRARAAAGWRLLDALPEADAARLAEALHRNAPAAFERSPEWLRWRFERAPDLAYRFGAWARGGKVAALAVMRDPLAEELPVGTLADVLADPSDQEAIVAAVGHAVAELAPRCEAIVAGASHPAHIAALRRHGFHAVRVHRPTIVTSDEALRARLAAHPGPWHMTKADHDWDQVHPSAD